MKVLNCLNDKYQLFIKQYKLIAIMHECINFTKIKLLIEEKASMT